MNKQKTIIKSSHDHLYIKLLNSKPDLVRFFNHTTIKYTHKNQRGNQAKKTEKLAECLLDQSEQAWILDRQLQHIYRYHQ